MPTEFVEVGDWTAEGLEKQCAELREILGDGVATSQELKDYWPGGKENPVPDPLGKWIYCYQQYGRMAGRLDDEKTDQQLARAEADVMSALRRAPVPIELVATNRDGSPRHLQVHPKSFETLAHIEARDRELRRLAEALEQLEDLPAQAQVSWGRKLLAEISYQQQVLCWIVTSVGPGLPFDEAKPRPKVPGLYRSLEPQDIVVILRGHRSVGALRLARVADLLGSGRAKGKRQSWAVLAATAASELGVSTGTLLRDWTLESWLAQLSLTADAKAQAIEQSKRKRAG